MRPFKTTSTLFRAPRLGRWAAMMLLCLPMMATRSAAQTAYAVYRDSTLTFYYDDNQPDTAYDMTFHEVAAYGKVPSWYELSDSVQTVVFDKSFDQYRPTDCTAWFCDYYLLSRMEGMEYFHTDSVRSMSNMFCACTSLYNVDLTHFNTEKVEDMSKMFFYCTGFSTLDLSFFNTSSVRDMSSMFYWCYYLETIFASETFTTGAVTNSQDMFNGCTALVGAIPFDPNRVTARYANYTDGYFTYKDPTGIRTAMQTASTDAAAYYDLQGRRLAGPQRGVYLVRQGGKMVKMMRK